MNLYLRLLRKYIEIHRKSKTLRRIWYCLACIVIFVTVYQLIIPTITLTKKNADNMAGISIDDGKISVLDCGLKVHQHEKSCYRIIDGKKTLVCGQADYVIHEHDDSCYAVNDKGKRVLVCELPEIKAHQHDDTCFEEDIVPVCDKEEHEGHEHTDECYETGTELICDKDEHIHDDSCYTELEDEDSEVTKELTCHKTEHEHDDDCYKTVKDLICDQKEEEGHTHTDECYETRKVLTCSESEPHEHTKKCYEKGHEGEADYLICGQLELKAHQHTKKCFTKVKEEDEDDSDPAESGRESAQKETEIETETESFEERETEEEKNDTAVSSESENEEETDPEMVDPYTDKEDTDSNVKEITFSRMLTDTTGIWRRVGEGDWVRVGKSTRLSRNENLMVRIAYSIAKGTLTNENATVLYELPANLGATWRTADRVNDEDNHLNQIIEGSRLPDEVKEGSENLAGYYEMTGSSDDEGEDHFCLELKFNDYTITENAARDVEGWMMFYLKDIALDHGEDGTGKIVFSKKAADGEEVSVSYIVTDDEDPESGDGQSSDETDVQGSGESAETEETDVHNTSEGNEPEPAEPVEEIVSQAQSFQASTNTLTVSVQAEEGAFPSGTTMTVNDVEDEDTLDSIREAASEEADSADIKYVHAVDITFKDKDDLQIEPIKPIRVSITYPEKADSEDAFVMHVDDDGDIQRVSQVDEADLAEKPADNELVFDADSFSIYAVVGTTIEKSVLAGDGNNYKITVTCGPESGVPKDAQLEVSEILPDGMDLDGNSSGDNTLSSYDEYVLKTREALGFTTGVLSYARFFDIKITDKYGHKVWINAPVDVRIELEDRTSNEETSDITAVMHFADDGKNGDVMGNVEVNEKAGCALSFEADSFSVYGIVTFEDMPGELDAKAFGIVNSANAVSGTAMLTKKDNNNNLKGQAMTVRADPNHRTENVFIAKNSNIPMWTFTYIPGTGNHYYITAEVDNDVKYLQIDQSGIRFVDYSQIDDTCKIIITEGTGSNTGKYKFTTSFKKDNGENVTRALTMSNGKFTSASGNTNTTSVWMNFAQLSELTDADFVNYKAKKVSVSDEDHVYYQAADAANNIPEKCAEVVIYTRVWNDNTKKYEYYALDCDGNLIKCAENGDVISWVGSRDQSVMLWKFKDKGAGYYSLQNSSTGLYLVPQFSDDGQETLYLKDESAPGVKDTDLSINLNGRYNGDYYTTILAWDEASYDYAGLAVDENDLDLVVKSRLNSYDFYFAVIEPYEEEQTPKLTQVETVDHTAYGIEIKMQNYKYGGQYISKKYRSYEQADVLGINTEYNGYKPVSGILTKHIGEDGYPQTNKNVTKTAESHSLKELFDDDRTQAVNHLFLKSTYEETGYFEYDCTKNFAHLVQNAADPHIQEGYSVGDFVVYDQIGTTEYGVKDSLKHGQFMPFNDLYDTPADKAYAIKNPTNETDLHGNALDPLDPRKGERLYRIPGTLPGAGPNVYPAAGDADYFFGMEMSAHFMQTESGQDDWGHDLIFEFSGDDDFWLYIDGNLVLDLGGVHSAIDGSINFKTGAVSVNGTPTTIRQCFKDAGYFPDGKVWDDDKADKYFKGDTFTDYSNHTLKIYYMERGASASNLHMRFNLAPFNEGEVLLEKEVEGSENVTAKFPFQIWFYDETLPDHDDPSRWRTVGVNDLNAAVSGKRITVRYPGRDNNEDGQDDDVEFDPRFSDKDNVFFLKSGETASIVFPKDYGAEDARYYIKECLIDSKTFDQVHANGEQLSPDDAAIVEQDFSIEDSTVANRKKVVYKNHVNEDALHTLTIKKRVWQEVEKQNEITDDNTVFSFRIFIGKSEGVTAADPQTGTPGGQLVPVYTVYGNAPYYVKNKAGEYCTFERNQGFVSTHKTDIHDLSTEVPAGQELSELQRATFETSPGGGVSKIPVGYSVEVRGLIDGTEYYVFERADEIPDGYKLIDYDEYYGETSPNNFAKADPDAKPASANYMYNHSTPDTMTNCYGMIDVSEHPSNDPLVVVNNQHGWHLKLDKVWTDQEFMKSHDTVYFAVYKEVNGTSALVDGSVYALIHPNTSLRWFFSELDEDTIPTADHAVDNKNAYLNAYKVYEVKLTPLQQGSSITYDEATGKVSGTPGTDYSITRITDENNLVDIGGIPKENTVSVTHLYSVTYDREELEHPAQENVRTDTVTNARSGIKIIKTDWDGDEMLEGAVFTLKDSSGTTVGASSFTSTSDGLVVVAYLLEGQEYTLTEVSAPFGYEKLITSLSIKEVISREDESHTLLVNDSAQDPDSKYYTVKQVPNPTWENMPTIEIRNKKRELKVIKKDENSEEPLAGAKFSIYKAIVDSTSTTDPPALMPAYSPMTFDGVSELVTDDEGIIPCVDLEHLGVGTYYLREKEPPNGYMKVSGDMCFTLSGQGEFSLNNPNPLGAAYETVENEDTGVITTTVTIKNKPKKSLQVLKKQTGTEIYLEDAEFKLYKIAQIGEDGKPLETEVDKPVSSGRTDANGILTLDVKLDEITNYYLYETDAPDGYIMLTDPVIITVTSNALKAAYQGRAIEVVTVEGTETMQITLENSAGYELPYTGGPGTDIFGLFGALLIAFAAAGMILVRKRKEIIY